LKNFEDARNNVINGGYKAFSLLNPYAYPPESHQGIADFEKEIKKLGNIVLPLPRSRLVVAQEYS